MMKSKYSCTRYELLKEILFNITKFSANFRRLNFFVKKDMSPVTELDIINQYIFVESIKYFFENDSIFAEEDLTSSFSKNVLLQYAQVIAKILLEIKNKKKVDSDIVCTWFIDPIDGTKGFIDNLTFSIAVSILKDNQFYASGLTSIGLHKSMKIKYDVIIATTDNNKVEFFNEDLVPIALNTLSCTNTIAISRKHKTKKLFKILQNKGYHLIEMDSQAKYMLVLLGFANYYIREQGSCGNSYDYSWDHLAGIHLVKMNNGFTADINANKPIYSEKNDKIEFKKKLITATSKKEYENILRELEGLT